MRKFCVALLFLVFPVVLFAKDYATVVFQTKDAGKVIFSHQVHLERLGKNCLACHNGIFKLPRKNEPVTMAAMEKGISCGACHGKNKVFPLSQCSRCHQVKEVAIEIKNFGAVTFSHDFHLGMYSCGDCHSGIFKPGDNPPVTMAQMQKGSACGACHDGKTGFSVKGDCVKCHVVKDVTFAAAAKYSHSFHVGMFACSECHPKIFIAGPDSKRFTMLDMQQGKSCGACHNGNMAFSVKGDCAKCHPGEMKNISFKADALFSHNIHTAMYGCGDCHSGIFIGGANSKRYTMPDMEKGKSCGTCHDGGTAFSVKSNCGKCHTTTKEISLPVKDAGTVTFSHAIHKEMFPCDQCHNAVFTTGVSAKRFAMAEMTKGKSCGSCHDGKMAFATADCLRCHPAKDKILDHDARFSHKKHLEMFSCNDCHNRLFVAGQDNKRSSMPDMENGRSCGGCHDGSTAFSVKGDCDKCHKTVQDVVFRTPQTGAIRFSHEVHVSMFKCGDCHNGIFTTGVASRRRTMADMEKGQSCGACHDGGSAFSVKSDCDKCHPVREIPFKDSGALFSHKFHLQAYSCTDCHNGIFATDKSRRFTMADMDKGKSCGTCHDGSTAFKASGSCEKCHTVTRGVQYSDLPGAGDVVFSHRVHLGRGYGCSSCHNEIIKTGSQRRRYTMKEMGEGKSCGACHGFSMAFSVKDANSCSRCHKMRQ